LLNLYAEMSRVLKRELLAMVVQIFIWHFFKKKIILVHGHLVIEGLINLSCKLNINISNNYNSSKPRKFQAIRFFLKW
jgi:hypothetical protein